MDQRLRILLIDDNRDDRELAERTLRREFPDADFRHINDAETLEAALAEGCFGIVITDFQLRWTDGLAVQREIMTRCPGVPVIMFTNTGTEEVCAEAMRKGLFDYIIKKPSHYVRLPMAVRAALEAVATRRQLAESLEQEKAARAESERANRLKDEFLALVSHELRTPLNAILGYATLMEADSAALPADMRDGLAVIARNARAQARMIDELLDLSGILTGKLRVERRRVDLPGVLRRSVEAHRAAAREKEIVLTLNLRGEAAVSGDAERLQQVFSSLVANALKFTPKGGRVDVTLEGVDGDVEVGVTDTGQGIAPEFLPFVFDTFRQQDASTTRRHGGLGIGLALVKRLVEMHNGSVRVRSDGPGMGTTFVVALPRALPP